MKKSYSKILSIKPAGKSKVYDFTVKDTHRILANNFYTSNCSIDHPDIIKFITSKDDLTKITGANISVKVTDEFLKAVETDSDYILKWPVDSKETNISEKIVYNKLYKRDDGSYIMKVKAKEIWDTIIRQAHKTAEPGVLFWDNIIKESPADCYKEYGFKTLGTNPCVVGDTLVAVADGRNPITIEQLAEEGKDIPVYSLDNNGKIVVKTMRNPRLTGYNQPIYEIKLDSGDSIKVTGNHKLRLKNGLYEEAKNLKYGDILYVSSISYNIKNKIKNYISYTFTKYIASKPTHQYNKDTKILKKYKDALSNGYNAKITDDNQVIVEKTCEKCGNKFWTSYDTREYAFCSAECSNEYINETMHKNERQINEGTEFYKVISVELCGYENVYNGTVDDYHNFFCGGFEEKTKSNKTKLIFLNNLQCGEVPLSPYDSCRLGSINLSNMVKNPYSDNASVDYNLLAKVSRFSQRFMDDLVSLEEEKIMEIIAKIESDPEDYEIKKTELNLWKKVLDVLRKGRRTGIGVLGLGDMLAKLGIRYSSKEATELTNKIFQTIAVNSYKESVNLAKERGCFPIWDANKESQNPFIIRVISNNFSTEEYNDYLKYGRRNIANLSIAPTGSLSILARTTSGIEPVFKCYYKRRRKINPNEQNVKIDYKDENGDCWQEYKVFHPEFKKWCLDKKGITSLESLKDEEINNLILESPWNNSESHNIDYLEKVNMQGVIQKWIDHSISVCLSKDTLIDTDKGLFYLDELTDFNKIKENEFKENTEFDGKVLTHKNRRSNITSFYNNGVKTVAEITLKNGLKIKSTLNERYLRLNEDIGKVEWVKLSDLKEGDRIMLKNQFKKI